MKIDRMSDDVTRLSFVRDALKPEPFPLDREGLYYAVGSVPIRQPSGREVPARDLIDRLDRDMFASIDDVITSLRGVLEPSPIAGAPLPALSPMASGLAQIGLGLAEMFPLRWAAKLIGFRLLSPVLLVLGAMKIYSGATTLISNKTA